MPNFEKIRAVIMDSAVSGDDKMKLIDMFAKIPDDSLIDVAKLFEKDTAWVEKMNDNRKKKEQAFSTGDKNLWNEIMEEEKKYLRDLTYDLD